VDTPSALRTRLFGARLRIALVPPAEAFANLLRQAGYADVRAENGTLSIAVDDPAARAPAVVRRLVEAGAQIQSVVPEEPPLEEVYLRLLQEEQPV
jgi:ABC-2 type transport system ATP-binding protein